MRREAFFRKNQMKQYGLPEDIRYYVHKNVVKRITQCVLLEAFIGILLYLVGERMFSGFGIIGQITLYVLVLLIPFAVFGVPFRLIDHAWSGRIVDVKIETKVAFVKGAPKMNAYWRDCVILFIETDEGKRIRWEAKSFGRAMRKGFEDFDAGQIEHHENDFCKGDRVHHFYGLKELWLETDRHVDHLSCLICGQQNPTERKQCWHCGYTLFKPNKRLNHE